MPSVGVQAVGVQAIGVQAIRVQAIGVQAIGVQAIGVQAIGVQAIVKAVVFCSFSFVAPLNPYVSMKCCLGSSAARVSSSK